MRADVPCQTDCGTLLQYPSGSPAETGAQEIPVGDETDAVHTRPNQGLGTLLPVAF